MPCETKAPAHYSAPASFDEVDPACVAAASQALAADGILAYVGASLTTDAPFRETADAIQASRDRNILAVEMEAAAFYTFARAQASAVLCLAHLTNTMGQAGDDFEKGAGDGAADALRIRDVIIRGLAGADGTVV